MGRGRGPRRVTNLLTGRTIPCVYGDCFNPGDDKINIATPVEQPEFPGQLRIYIFCSELHRDLWAQQMAGNPNERL